MSAAIEPGRRFTVDDFVAWAEGRTGRYELYGGSIFAMAPERAGHAEAKLAAVNALAGAVRRAGLPCFALPDGMTVRVDEETAFEPDALVYCGAKLPPEAIVVPDPIVVVEVLSPSNGRIDSGRKLIGYFRIPSIQHYLVVDADRRVIVHHRRTAGLAIETMIVGSGALRLDPPGLDVAVADFWPA